MPKPNKITKQTYFDTWPKKEEKSQDEVLAARPKSNGQVTKSPINDPNNTSNDIKQQPRKGREWPWAWPTFTRKLVGT